MEITSLIIADGSVQDTGGGIRNSGTLTIRSSVIRGNEAVAIDIGLGGGIFNSPGAELVIEDSTIGGDGEGEGNFGITGGGIYSQGTLSLLRSALIGNAAHAGAAIAHSGESTLIVDSTISGNEVGSGGAGVFAFGAVTVLNSTVTGTLGGPEIRTSGPGSVLLQNSIILPPSGFDACQNPISSLGNNLTNDATCGFDATPGDGDIVCDPDDAVTPCDPGLGPLAENGGSTLTHALLPGSPALDNGNNTPCSMAYDPVTNPDASGPFDQRGEGFPRIAGSACDIGAFEAGLTLTKTPSADTVPSTGAILTYTIEIVNEMGVAVTLESLADDAFGDILDANNAEWDPLESTCRHASLSIL